MSQRISQLSRAVRLGYGDRARRVLLTIHKRGQVENLLVLGEHDIILPPSHAFLMSVIPDFVTALGLHCPQAYAQTLTPRLHAQLGRFLCAASSEHPLSRELRGIRRHPLQHGEYTWYSLMHYDEHCAEYLLALPTAFPAVAGQVRNEAGGSSSSRCEMLGGHLAGHSQSVNRHR